MQPTWSSSETDLSGSPTIANGRVYIGAHDGNLYAFDAHTGKFLWKQPTGGAIEATPAVADGIVFVGSDDGKLYAIDAQKGTIDWSIVLGAPTSPVLTSPTIANNIVYVGANTSDTFDYYDYLYAINAKSGKVLWKVPFSVNISTPVIAGGIAYVTACNLNDSIYAYDVTTGKQLWAQSTTHCPDNPVVGNGFVYVNSYDKFYALDATTGQTRWVSQGGAGDIAINDEVVYMSDNGLQALDAKTGNPLEPTWTVLAQEGAGSPMIVNGVIYDCSVDGNLYAFNLKTKAQLWSATVYSPGYLTSFPPTPVIANGTIYINTGQLIAFRLQS